MEEYPKVKNTDNGWEAWPNSKRKVLGTFSSKGMALKALRRDEIMALEAKRIRDEKKAKKEAKGK